MLNNLNFLEDAIEKNKSITYTILFFAALPWLGSLIITPYLSGDIFPAYLESAVENRGTELLFLYVVATILMSFSMVVNTLIILIGAYYLKYESLLYLSPAYMIACSIGYGIGKLLPKAPILKLIEEVPQFKEIATNMQGSQLTTVGLTKMSPILPFVVTNALFGVLEFNFFKFFIGSFLGKWPRVLLFTFIGATINSLRDISNKNYNSTFTWIIGAVILVVSLTGLYFTLIKKKR